MLIVKTKIVSSQKVTYGTTAYLIIMMLADLPKCVAPKKSVTLINSDLILSNEVHQSMISMSQKSSLD